MNIFSVASILCFLLTVEAGNWDSYIVNLISQSKDASGRAHVDKAVIFGIDGGGQWTTNSHPNAFKLSDTERAAIARAFKTKDFSGLQSNGIWAEGIKYQFLREEDGELFLGKKKDHGAVSAQISKTAVVMAHVPEGSQQGNGNKAVAVIAEYLESLGV